MSRVGNNPIEVPGGVRVKVEGRKIDVSGPKGELSLVVPPVLTVNAEGKHIRVGRKAENKHAKSLHGLNARLIGNMVSGVSRGFEKKLEVVGVGYRVQMEGTVLVMQLGFSHPVRYTPPDGVTIRTEGSQIIVVNGCDCQKVGEAAAQIRRFRPPEPYKGKGIKYEGEYIRRKAGKAIT